MYSSLKTVAVFSVILSVVNAIAAVLTIMFLIPIEGIGYTSLLAIGAFLGSTSLLFLVLSFFLFSLYADLSAHEDSNYDDLSSLRKRVDDLEKMLKK